jgi:hypothetical protein
MPLIPGTTSVDEDLSQLALSTLSISLSKEVVKCTDSDFLMPKQRHGVGLYTTTLRDTSMAGAATTTTTTTTTTLNSQLQGVPGFPDFPDFWCGEEGWAVWKRNDAATEKLNKGKTSTTQLGTRSTQQVRQFRRQPVNTVGGIITNKRSRKKRQWKQPKAKVMQRTTKRTERRRKMVQHLKHRRQMAVLRRSLASLSCS